MIVYDLCCRPGSHVFEGWFASSTAFAEQAARGLVTCPVCGSAEVTRTLSAPNLGRKGNQVSASVPAPAPAPQASAPLPPEAIAALKAIAKMQAEALKSSTWVGARFADKARAMHYGETDAVPIHGQATADEAQALVEEGIAVAPILFPVVPPDQAN